MNARNRKVSTPQRPLDLRTLAESLARSIIERRDDVRLEWEDSHKSSARIQNEVGLHNLPIRAEPPRDPERYRELCLEVEKLVSVRGWKLNPDGAFSGCQLQDLRAFPRLHVCTSCTSLKLPEPREKPLLPCPCTEEARWSFQKARLCKCCGQVLLENISRFSVWFCVGCMAPVRDLNASLQRYAVPIGAHSILGGVGLKGDSSTLDIEIFAAKLEDIGGAMKSVHAWGEIVKRRVAAERWPSSPHALVPIAEWDRRLDREEPMRWFGEMIDFLSGNGNGEGAE